MTAAASRVSAYSRLPDDAGAVDAGQHAPVAQPLDGMGRALTSIVSGRLDDIAHLLEQVDQQVLLE